MCFCTYFVLTLLVFVCKIFNQKNFKKYNLTDCLLWKTERTSRSCEKYHNLLVTAFNNIIFFSKMTLCNWLNIDQVFLFRRKTHFYLKHFWGTRIFLWGFRYPCSGFLIWRLLLASKQMWIPEIHLWVSHLLLSWIKSIHGMLWISQYLYYWIYVLDSFRKTEYVLMV